MRTPLGLLALLALGSCVGTPPPPSGPPPGPPVPEAWTARADAGGEVLDTWWRSFDDPALSRMVEEALDQNHDLRAAAARVEAAAVQARLAGADLVPRLDANFDGTRQRQNFIGLPIPGAGSKVLSRTYTRYGVGLSASWELDVWGRVRAGRSAAAADLQATAADYAFARQSLAAQAVRAYLAAVEAERQIALGETTVASYEQTVAHVQDRVGRGLSPALDLRLARTDLEKARADLQARRESATRARRQLELLLGRYPADTLTTSHRLPQVPATVPAGLPAQLLQRRPDVVAAERRLAAASKRVDEARAALFPRISLTASAGTASQEIGDLLDSDFFVWTLAGNLLQPIVDGGRLRGQVALREAAAREQVESYAQAALTAYTEVEVALAAEQLLRQREQSVEQAEQQAQAAKDIAEERYRRGVERFLPLLEAQRRAVAAASEQIAVRRQILDARVDLHLALGGGFHRPEPHSGDSP